MRHDGPTTSYGASLRSVSRPGCTMHVMSSGEEAWQCLRRRDDPFYAALGRRCLHIGSERDLEIRRGWILNMSMPPRKLNSSSIPDRQDGTTASRITSPATQRAGPRLPMICANPDLVVLRGSTLHLCAGALAQML